MVIRVGIVLIAILVTIATLTFIQNSLIVIGIAGVCLVTGLILWFRKPPARQSLADLPANQLSLTLTRRETTSEPNHWHWDLPQPNSKRDRR